MTQARRERANEFLRAGARFARDEVLDALLTFAAQEAEHATQAERALAELRRELDYARHCEGIEHEEAEHWQRECDTFRIQLAGAEQAIEQARAEERERCAQETEAFDSDDAPSEDCRGTARVIASALRTASPPA